MPETEIDLVELEAKKAAIIQSKLETWFKKGPRSFFYDDPDLDQLDELGITEKEMMSAFKKFREQNPEVVKGWEEDMSKEARSFWYDEEGKKE